MTDLHLSPTDQTSIALPEVTSAQPLRFDADKYLRYVDDVDLPEDQKRELLEALWNILAALVDIGFGVDSVQQILPALFSSSATTDGTEVPATKEAEGIEAVGREQ